MNSALLTCKRLSGRFQRTFILYQKRLSRLSSSHPNVKLMIGISIVPLVPSVFAKSDLKNEPSSATEDNTSDDEKESGWDRLQAMYRRDEYGNLSKELIATIQTTFAATLFGFIYGGAKESRIAFLDFMERNQATIFDNHLDAKRRLQNHVSIHFAKGGFRWGVKLSAFTGGFMLFLTSLSTYRGRSSILDYVVSGALVGTLLRIQLGPPSMVVGGTLGGILGLFCGLSSISLLSLFEADLDEVISFQYEIDRSRYRAFQEALKKDVEKEAIPDELGEYYKLREQQNKENTEKK